MKQHRSQQKMTPRRAERGVTLVELMVGMAISLLIAAAIGSLYIGSKESARLQDGTSAARESAAAITEDITREVRQAGNYGCYVPKEGAKPLVTARLPKGLNGRWILPVDGSGEARVGADYAVYGGAMSAAILPTGSSLTPVAGSDYVTFNRGQGVASITEEATGASALKLSQLVRTSTGQPFVLADCDMMTVFRSDSGGKDGALKNELSRDPSLGDNTAPPGVGSVAANTFQAGSTVFALAAVTLFVATDTNNVTSLYRLEERAADTDIQPFAANVINLKVQYGRDAAGTIVWEDGATIDGAGAWGSVIAVRTSFVVASSETSNSVPKEFVWSAAKDAFIPGTVDATDKKPRQAYSVTSTIRGRVDIGTRV